MAEKTKQRVLVAITGSQKPYVYDLPQILALPASLEFRFRYRDRWLDPEVRKQVNQSVTSEPILLVFWSQKTKRLIPLRWARLQSLVKYGPVTYCSFTLRSFATGLAQLSSPDLAKSLFPNEQNLDLGGELPSHLFWASRDALHIPDGLDRGEDAAQAAPFEWAGAWWEIVRRFAPDEPDGGEQAEPDLVGLPLFHVLGFFDEKKRPSETPLPPQIIRNKNDVFEKIPVHGYKLLLGENYRLRIVQWCRLERGSALVPPLELECVTETSGLKEQGSSNRVYGRYDVIDIDLRGHAVEMGEISLKTSEVDVMPSRSENDSATPLASWASIDAFRIPVRVVPSTTRIAGGFALALFGFVLLFAVEIAGLHGGWALICRLAGSLLVAAAFPTLGPVVSTAAGVHRMFR